MMITALDHADPPRLASRLHHLDVAVEVGRRARRRSGRCRRRGARLTRARSATDVPFERTLTASPVAIWRRSRVVVRRARPRLRAAGTGARGRARRPGRRRAAGSGAGGSVPRKCSAGAAAAGGIGATGARLGRARTAPGPAAAPARRPRRTGIAAVERSESSAKTSDGVRRELDAEALGELRDPGELVRHGRDHGCGAGAARDPRG